MNRNKHKPSPPPKKIFMFFGDEYWLDFVLEYMDYNCSNLAYGSTDQFSRTSDSQVKLICQSCVILYLLHL